MRTQPLYRQKARDEAPTIRRRSASIWRKIVASWLRAFRRSRTLVYAGSPF
jgi:hypothetical protein